MKAISTMRDPTKVVNKMYNAKSILPSRQIAVDMMMNEVRSRMNTARSLTVTGMKETGKTTLMRAAAVQLSKAGYPTIYVEANPDQDIFCADILSAIGVYNDVASVSGLLSDVQWMNIVKLLNRVCCDIDGGNVVIIDGINRDIPYLDDIQSLQRNLSEEYPQTVVVLVTSDGTDLFSLKQESRRSIHTVWPFDSKAMKEYLETECDVKADDVEQALEVINQKYTSSLIKIEEMFRLCLKDNGRMDFDAVANYIQKEEAKMITKIRVMCGNEETMKKLQEFVKEKCNSAFSTWDWHSEFGDFAKDDSLGFKLLKSNQLLWIADQELSVFHNAITRNCVNKIIST